MPEPAPTYPFFSQLARIINAGQSRSVLLYGEVHDLYYVQGKDDYVPLVDFLCTKCAVPGLIVVVYELNGPIRFVHAGDRDKLRDAWIAWKAGADADELLFHGVGDRARRAQYDALRAEFHTHTQEAIGRPTVALEFLRQLTLCSRSTNDAGRSFLTDSLLIVIEAADMLLPSGDGSVARLAPADRHRISVVQDWFSDPGYMNGKDSVIMLSESRGLVHPRITGLPQVLSVEVPAPDTAVRTHYADWYLRTSAADPARPQPRLWAGKAELARLTAGVSIHALRQLLIAAAHAGEPVSPEDAIVQVERYISAQLGEDVVEFKKPSHTLADVVGFTRLKAFIHSELLPRFQASDEAALPGAAVAGPIGGGKTFIFEAVAAELDLPVLVLKNIRSQWYGQTDVLFERLRRVLQALHKVIIFVDEADTQFGGIDATSHETERRLTGKIQQMMSDPRLRGRVVWLLMTARIHRLSPDIRRPGRVGDLIIPVLDPEGEDRQDFIRWMLEPALGGEPEEAAVARFDAPTQGWSAATFASLRSNLKAMAAMKRRGEEAPHPPEPVYQPAGPQIPEEAPGATGSLSASAGATSGEAGGSGMLEAALTIEEIEAVIHDQLQPAIESTRRYQTLQALVNCTRRSLLPDPEVTEEARERWQAQIRELEAKGIR